jgi:cysteine synthase A
MLKSLSYYNIGNTPIFKLDNLNIYIKMEKFNQNGSIKDRTAYFLIQDILKQQKFDENTTIIESTSGNLGISLDFFAKNIGVKFKALIDKTISLDKLEEFDRKKIEYIMTKSSNLDYRSARIKLAQKLNKKNNFIWTNQYDNFANMRAHYISTAPEIWEQMSGKIDILVVSIGTGGTIAGIAKFLKEQNSKITVCGVEPIGSTIFGGVEQEYINVGIGLKGKDKILEKYINLIDFNFKVSDKEAINITKKYKNIGFGISTGYALKVALDINKKYPDKNIVVISPDGIENYRSIIDANL